MMVKDIKEKIQTSNAPAAIGPYSQAVRAGDLVFMSGQIPLDPASGEMVEGGIEEQTRQVLANMKAVLAAAGLEMDNIVKTTVYMTDLSKFQTVNAIYAEAFSDPAPARAAIEVSALPKGSLVEIEAVARASKKEA